MPDDVTRLRPGEIAKQLGPNMFERAYAAGKNLSQYLEEIDPTDGYPEAERGLDAFERVTQAMGIVCQTSRALGLRASTYEDVTATEQGRAWFAEYAARVWREASQFVDPRLDVTRALAGLTPQQRATFLSTDYIPGGAGMAWADQLAPIAPKLQPAVPLAAIIAGTQMIDGDAYRAVYITDSLSDDAYSFKRVGEGAPIPMTSMVTGEHTLRLHKFGRGLRYTYEQIRRQRIDRIAFMVARMAMKAESDKVQLALDTIVSGDGNANTAATVYTLTSLDAAATAGTLTLNGWDFFKNRFVPYVPDVVLGQEASIGQLENLPISTGNSLPLRMLSGSPYGSLRPLNPTAWQIGAGVVAGAPSLKLVAFNSGETVEQLAEIGADISEVEKFAQSQVYQLTMSETIAFGIIDPSAARILNINA